MEYSVRVSRGCSRWDSDAAGTNTQSLGGFGLAILGIEIYQGVS
jgi:hypothetical protein